MTADTTENIFTEHSDPQLKKLKKVLTREKNVFERVMQQFIDLENELDQNSVDHKKDTGRRRKSYSFKNFEFQGVSNRFAIEDLNEIYDGLNDDDGFGPENFRKNDSVSCLVDRKKYNGTIISVNQKGMVVRSNDRRKIKISWDDIEDGRAKVEKIVNEDE